MSTRGRASSRRAQSEVVGVALLLSITMIALAGLTASIGAVVQENAASADAASVAADLPTALRPVEATGTHRGVVTFTGGELTVVERELRVLHGDGVVRTVAVGALVFERGHDRVAYVAGAVVRGRPGRATLRRPPPITASRGSGGVLVVGAPRLGAAGRTVAATEPTTVTLHTNVTHRRSALGNATWRVAIETATPGPFVAYFERTGATVVADDRDFDGDGVPSVVARYPGRRVAYLVVHAMRLEVTIGG